MYAIVKTGGKQYKVAKGDLFEVEKLDAEAGETVALDVIFLADGSKVTTEADALGKAKVFAEVVEHFKGDKEIVFKFKKRKGYKRLRGHRQGLTRLLVQDISLTGTAPKKKAVDEKPVKGKKADAKADVKAKAATEQKAPKAQAKAEPKAKAETAEKKPAAAKKAAPAKATTAKAADAKAADSAEKKPVAKKPAAKKAAEGETAAKKPAAKKAATAASTKAATSDKEPAAKKAAPAKAKKAAEGETAVKKPAAKKAAPKKAAKDEKAE
jgi:large subunit ribosomal protein L21